MIAPINDCSYPLTPLGMERRGIGVKIQIKENQLPGTISAGAPPFTSA
jgi:hypothetical protein